MIKNSFKLLIIFFAISGLVFLAGCSAVSKTPAAATSTLTSLRMGFSTPTPQPSLTPTVDNMLVRPTLEPNTQPTIDPLQLTPAVQIIPAVSRISKGVVGVSFNDAGNELAIITANGVYFYNSDKLTAVKVINTGKIRTDPSYTGSTDTFSVASSPNREWLVLGQWSHYNSANGKVERGVITVLHMGNGVSKILGLDQIPNSMAAPFIAVRYTPDNLDVAAELDSSNGQVQVWDTRGQLLYTQSVYLGLKNLDFSPTAPQYAICATNGEIEIHESKKGLLLGGLAKFTNTISGAACGLAYSHDGSLLAYYGDNQLINLYATSSPNLTRHLPGQNTALNQIIFSPDDKSLGTLGIDSLVRVWSIDGHKVVYSWADPKVGINWIRYTPDGRYLLGGGADGQIRVWDPLAKRLVAKIDGLDAAFSPDSKLMSTFTADGNVMVWKMADLALQ